ncbi:MAG TPA: SAM-dependent methyltransferase [Streptosporangiaceae bacterium]
MTSEAGVPSQAEQRSRAALLSPPGQELLARLSGQEVSPGDALRLARELRASYPPELVAAALTQQALRMSGRKKFSRADSMLFTRAGLEQASSELAARHSARRFSRFSTVADLCCGIGGNLASLAASSRVLAVDRDLATLEFARHNAAACEARHPVLAVCADVRELVAGLASAPAAGRGPAVRRAAAGPGRRPVPGVEAAFIDPARRAGDRRLRAGRSEPPLDWCLGLTDWVPAVGIKAAPGLPRELIPPGWEAEFLAVGRDLKEALLWSPALASAPRRATILPGGNTLTPHPGAPVPVGAPGAFLLDPSPAVTRAGLVEDLARILGAWKIDPMIAFLAADRDIRTPFARTLRVLESMPWNEKQAARRLRELGIGAADIRRRGLAGDVDLIRRRLGLRGEGRATIVLTRREDRPWGLICTSPDD